MSQESSVRQRKGKAAAITADQPVEEVEVSEAEDTEPIEKPKPTTEARVKDEDQYSPWLDVLRVLSFLILASCALSYLISGGESWTWGMRHPPKYLKIDFWKSRLQGPLYLTLEELAQYGGTDETKPIYLAINGTIYDVSSNRRTYGPGGSYNIFAGVDASRGFVTGCFKEDRTADMRGVEDMFIPVDNPEVDKLYTFDELRQLKRRERRDAKKKVHDSLAHWVKFFANSPKYQQVGYVKREKGWIDYESKKLLCETAQKGRPKRKLPEKN